jgi:hypothetical protein
MTQTMIFDCSNWNCDITRNCLLASKIRNSNYTVNKIRHGCTMALKKATQLIWHVQTCPTTVYYIRACWRSSLILTCLHMSIDMSKILTFFSCQAYMNYWQLNQILKQIFDMSIFSIEYFPTARIPKIMSNTTCQDSWIKIYVKFSWRNIINLQPIF